ncbi:MAG: hypothetical protein WD273_01860 [Trueperaceae bacterium]
MEADMDIAPLALVVLLGYGLLIAVSLTVWTIVSYRRDAVLAETQQPERQARVRAGAGTMSNDDVRGARSRREGGAQRTELKRSELKRSEPKRSEPKRSEPKQSRPKQSQPQQSQAKQSETVVVERRRDVSRPAPVIDSRKESDEDAFERFLRARPDDFDIR